MAEGKQGTVPQAEEEGQTAVPEPQVEMPEEASAVQVPVEESCVELQAAGTERDQRHSAGNHPAAALQDQEEADW